MKKTDVIWCVALIVIIIASVIWAGSIIIGVRLPDAIARTIGIVDLLACPVIIYTTVKKMQKKD